MFACHSRLPGGSRPACWVHDWPVAVVGVVWLRTHMFVVRVLCVESYMIGMRHEGEGKVGRENGVLRQGGGGVWGVCGCALTPSSCRPTLTPSTPCSSLPSAAWTLFSVSLLSRNLYNPLCQQLCYFSGLFGVHDSDVCPGVDCSCSFATHMYLCRRRKM